MPRGFSKSAPSSPAYEISSILLYTMALNEANTANDITALCDELKSQLSAIAGDEEQQLADLQSTQEDLERALKNLFPKLTSSKPTKVEKWISKVNGVAQGLYTIIDSAAGLGGPIGNIVWGSVKILLQVCIQIYILHPFLLIIFFRRLVLVMMLLKVRNHIVYLDSVFIHQPTNSHIRIFTVCG